MKIETSILREDNLIVFSGYHFIDNVYWARPIEDEKKDEAEKLFLDVHMDYMGLVALLLSNEAIEQYNTYKKFINSVNDNDHWSIEFIKQNGFFTKVFFTSKEILYFDMTMEG